ncbi:MAG: C-terminal binding protein [Nitrospinota bacterium]
MATKRETPIVAVVGARFGDLAIEEKVLRPTGCRLVRGPGNDAASIIELCRGATGVLAGAIGPQFTAEVVSSLGACRVIARYGVGVDNIDVETAKKKGIIVTNVPDYCVDEVSDHAMAFILTFARKLDIGAVEAKKGDWSIGPLQPIHSLRGSVLGIAGIGRIGSALARKARAFGMKVAAFDPIAPEPSFRRIRAGKVSLNELLRMSDYLSLHAPLTPKTRGMIGKAQLERMKPEAVIVNVARGGLIDEEALAAALSAKRIRGAGLDVLMEEPPSTGHPLLALPNCIITPHKAWYSVSAQEKLRRGAAGEVLRVLRGREPKYRVV